MNQSHNTKEVKRKLRKFHKCFLHFSLSNHGRNNGFELQEQPQKHKQTQQKSSFPKAWFCVFEKYCWSYVCLCVYLFWADRLWCWQLGNGVGRGCALRREGISITEAAEHNPDSSINLCRATARTGFSDLWLLPFLVYSMCGWTSKQIPINL